ncbi:PLDc N-terminal domain-containing protein [Algoriphagus marinus]|uniref:PLDc N-terminal domain-containing protein n=1 Tax=Algoriphagus marinus TaxID=1925762 RepID=UPI0009F9ADB0
MILSFIQNIGGSFLIILSIISFIYLILMIYCLVDIIRSEFKDPNMKLIWIIIILFAQLIGTLVYLVIGKSTKKLTY